MSERSLQIPGRHRSALGVAESGFTLVEAMISLFIVSLAILVMVQASSRVLRTQSSEEGNLEAVAIAELQLEAISLMPDDSLDSYSYRRSGEASLDDRRYVWRATVERERDTRLWRATVSVEWSGGVFDLETMFFRPQDERLRRLMGP